MKPRVRFAPSPTGHLHVGGARTALFNWLYARHHGGAFLLRIEDTDQSRSTEESIKGIQEGLSWLGLDWDEYFRQTERSSLHQQYAQQLLKADRAYESEGALWFRLPREDCIVVDDRIMGEVEYQTEELKDFVIRRSDGTFTYNFACVVDDLEMDISHVMRGDDHLNNTPKQICVYRALGEEEPEFAHFPMILGEDGKRLSKRHGATSLLNYRRQGYLPEALMNFLARLGWSHGDQEIFSSEELIELFELENVGSSPAIFDDEKLMWLNHEWMKRTPLPELGEKLKDRLLQEQLVPEERTQSFESGTYRRVAELMRERNKTLTGLAEASKFVFVEELEYSPELAEKQLTENVSELLIGLAHKLEELEQFEKDRIEELTRTYLDQQGESLGAIAQACRVALTGREVSPGLFVTMELLGKEATTYRLESFARFRHSSSEG